MSTKFLVLMTLVAVTACASAGANSTGTRREATVITEEEIAASKEATAFDVVYRLRPMFLKTRGATTIHSEAHEYASVFVDGVFYGDPTTLRNIVADHIHEIRYLNGPEAVGKYGNRYGSGAIDVRIK
jgi:hypothetical protein